MVVYSLNINAEITDHHFEQLKLQLPIDQIDKIYRLHKFQDRLRNLFGSLLLKRAWYHLFKSRINLEQLKTSKFGRPYMPNFLGDFNISHSGKYVVCALSAEHRVGIDIEQVREVDLTDFTRTMSELQWEQIRQSPNALDCFYQYWTIKESVIKADGRGLSIPLTDIVFKNNRASYDGQQWFLKPFWLDAFHPGCLASNQPINKFELVEVNCREFLI